VDHVRRDGYHWSEEFRGLSEAACRFQGRDWKFAREWIVSKIRLFLTRLIVQQRLISSPIRSDVFQTRVRADDGICHQCLITFRVCVRTGESGLSPLTCQQSRCVGICCPILRCQQSHSRHCLRLSVRRGTGRSSSSFLSPVRCSMGRPAFGASRVGFGTEWRPESDDGTHQTIERC
jgi:hypothetical protein